MKLVEIFETVKDFRVINRSYYNLAEILVLSLCAVLSGADDFEEIEEYGHQKEEFLRGFLELPNGIPSHDTINRVFRLLDKSSLEECLRTYSQEILSNLEHHNLASHQINIDGKVLRATGKRGKKTAALCLVNAWSAEHCLSLGQVKVDKKSNEKTAIPEIIRTVDIKGALVSIDAMGCDKKIASLIVENEGDYLLALKKNQKGLYEEVHDWMQSRKETMQSFEQQDYVGGRIEIRKTYVTQNLSYIDEASNWRKSASIIMIEGERKFKNGEQKDTFQTRYYISSAIGDAEYFGTAIRNHWSIENKLHWFLDVIFNEDRQRVREGNAPDNMALMRKIALQLLLQNKGKSSLKKARKRAAWNNEFLMQVLHSF
jgi:predicted transposase YbfD/YdcC